MMEQYLRLKRENEDAVLFFHLGDFYETFFDDAKTASDVLHITLTSRPAGKGSRVPMAGIPCHAAQRYIGRLLNAGMKVAVCEQVGDPKQSKGLVHRETTRVITPGTILDEGLLEEKTNNFLAAVAPDGDRSGLAFVDLSTGEFRATELDGELGLVNEVGRIWPREVIFPEGWSAAGFPERLETEFSAHLTRREQWEFMPARCRDVLLEHFGVNSLEALGCESLPLCSVAAGALVSYLHETQKSALGHIVSLGVYSTGDCLVIDPATQRNLELTVTLRGERGPGTLLDVLDETVTAMGGRRLRAWLMAPLGIQERIEERLQAVGALVAAGPAREKIRAQLSGMGDLERIVGRLSCGSGGPRELRALRASLEKVPGVRVEIAAVEAPGLAAASGALDPVEDASALIASALVDSPAATVRDGGVIREGYDAELDELRSAKRDGKRWIAELEQRETRRTGITSLKVKFNRVFGYSIEVTKAHLEKVPADYIRKQTLAGAERYITPELKEQEARILGAEERANELEAEILNRVRADVAARAARILETAGAVALIDALASLAEVAVDRGYVRPQLVEERRVSIRDGRHPVLERLMPAGSFVPNDVELDAGTDQILVITGPNMAGKSTYIRQVALTVIMAQMGSFVPAGEAVIGPVDRVFTRVGSSDELARGRSTFMVEMNETAAILSCATGRSLIVLDEIGRGTSTFDGVSIAWAVVEHLHGEGRVHPLSLFATHYHELTGLSVEHERVKNYNVAVKEWGDKVVFLRKVVPGGSDRSYGIHVARLAGLPPSVLERAKTILAGLEAGQLASGLQPGPSGGQMDLFGDRKHPLVEELSRLEAEEMTPLEALAKLAELSRRAREEDGTG